MSGVYDMDDLYAALSDVDDHIKQLHGTLIAIAAGLESITFLLSEDLGSRNPEAWERAQKGVQKQAKEWKKMIKEQAQ